MRCRNKQLGANHDSTTRTQGWGLGPKHFWMQKSNSYLLVHGGRGKWRAAGSSCDGEKIVGGRIKHSGGGRRRAD